MRHPPDWWICAKIEATEKFTSVLLKEMKQREDDARKDEDEDEEKDNLLLLCQNIHVFGGK